MQKLIAIRQEKNLSRQELASMVGVSYMAISNYERGFRFPKRNILNKLSVALDCSIVDII